MNEIRQKLFDEHPELEEFMEESPGAFEALVNLVTYEITKDFRDEFKSELDKLKSQMQVDVKESNGDTE